MRNLRMVSVILVSLVILFTMTFPCNAKKLNVKTQRMNLQKLGHLDRFRFAMTSNDVNRVVKRIVQENWEVVGRLTGGGSSSRIWTMLKGRSDEIKAYGTKFKIYRVNLPVPPESFVNNETSGYGLAMFSFYYYSIWDNLAGIMVEPTSRGLISKDVRNKSVLSKLHLTYLRDLEKYLGKVKEQAVFRSENSSDGSTEIISSYFVDNYGVVSLKTHRVARSMREPERESNAYYSIIFATERFMSTLGIWDEKFAQIAALNKGKTRNTKSALSWNGFTLGMSAQQAESRIKEIFGQFGKREKTSITMD